MKYDNYEVVATGNLISLNECVRKMINTGWQPIGGMVFNPDRRTLSTFYQTMGHIPIDVQESESFYPLPDK